MPSSENLTVQAIVRDYLGASTTVSQSGVNVSRITSASRAASLLRAALWALSNSSSPLSASRVYSSVMTAAELSSSFAAFDSSEPSPAASAFRTGLLDLIRGLVEMQASVNADVASTAAVALSSLSGAEARAKANMTEAHLYDTLRTAHTIANRSQSASQGLGDALLLALSNTVDGGIMDNGRQGLVTMCSMALPDWDLCLGLRMVCMAATACEARGFASSLDGLVMGLTNLATARGAGLVPGAGTTDYLGGNLGR